MKYEDFVKAKRRSEVPTGHNPGDLNSNLFDFQRTIVSWAIRRGRAAIFADTGLGKTLMQLSWAHEVVSHTGGSVLVLAPLAVSEQTIEQGAKFGIEVKRVPNGESVDGPCIWITNYERIDAIDFGSLAGLVLDESSILKSQDGKTRTKIIEQSQSVPYRLSCTATPSPNDFDELGNQCEFLGVMTRNEMLATYFVNDTGDTGTWKLKGWGASRFWEWMGSWAVVLRSPSDLGFDGSRYELPPLEYFEHVVETEPLGDDLFSRPAMTLTERRKAQRNSIEERCKALADVVNADSSEPWLIWCHLNDEAEMLQSLIPGSVNVQGSDSAEFKIAGVQWFCGNDSLQNTELCDELTPSERSLLGWTIAKKSSVALTCTRTTQANKEKFRPKSQEKREQYNESRRKKYATDPEMQQKYREAAKSWSASNPEKRKTQRVKQYGIDGPEYDRMLHDQGGVCAICKSPSTGDKRGGRFHVDHCHTTGKVRGLLCLSCNHGLGKFKDSTESLKRAIEYLNASKDGTGSD